MEAFLDTLGAVALIALVVVGLAAGAIAGAVAGRNRILYLVLGVVGAVALPFIFAALGVTVVAAGGLLLLLVVAAIGAALVLALVAALRR
ncbi:GlsB/YeaQ/YmgE family stress response membrane protein [Sulfitobacter faviae]|uniref:GlsB/YeaQ/YmgE family stress response membrane protein n=1 Tax=Sulfitobacter faviae TaxID=1775881 RepID=UPI00398CDD9C